MNKQMLEIAVVRKSAMKTLEILTLFGVYFVTFQTSRQQPIISN
ncbi:MAG: hypothetical protein ABWX58_12740 [Psychrobacillus psychrotolerans]